MDKKRRVGQVVVFNILAFICSGCVLQTSDMRTALSTNFKSPNMRIAIPTSQPEYIHFSEELTSGLMGLGFDVMDRNQTDSILKEHKLAFTGLVDPNSAKELGKFLGVDAIGILWLETQRSGENVEKAKFKLINIQTGQIILDSTYACGSLIPLYGQAAATMVSSIKKELKEKGLLSKR